MKLWDQIEIGGIKTIMEISMCLYKMDQRVKKDLINPTIYKVEDMLSRILNQVEGTNKDIKEIKCDFSTLNQTLTSYSISIKQLEVQLCKLSTALNLRKIWVFLSDKVINPKIDKVHYVEIVTQSRKVLANDVVHMDKSLDEVCWCRLIYGENK